MTSRKFQIGSGQINHAFTLVEMLVVIAVMSILAAMIFPVTGAVKRRATIARAQAELAQIETAIDRYKAKYGFYPPDNRGNPAINQLYFELLGTVLVNIGNVDFYETLDGATKARADTLTTTFGPGVAGFINCTRGRGGGDEGTSAVNFLPGLKPTQVAELKEGDPSIKLLVCSINWPQDHPYQPVQSHIGINPWRYVSSSPTNNPGSYDLWVDLFIRGKTNRISNWSRQPQIVAIP